ncbi:uncharacterized protein LOC110234382 [Exaiptasia diaphana]|uniref:Uncharacterized protein n=1 Tax=Exaiptasia diaphana TaxID=2652724 RepID=A0A913WWZ8_EXADI|nr:uncharacterized protein LOC110234382 [Exaiptasia diaphana]
MASTHLHASRSVGNLPAIGKREDGEGLESCEKTNFEEYSPDCHSAVDGILRDTISDLQKALYESKRLLSERDNEILSLRNEVEEMRRRTKSSPCTSVTIEEEFKKSQRKVIELEKTIQQLQADISTQRSQKNDILKQSQETEANQNGGHTCYCGSMCVAMKEVVDLKRKLHQTEQKYIHLKRNMRTMERNRVKVGVAQRDSPCSVS